jgi:hypothetical protein
MVATIERFFVDADERGNSCLLNLLEKQQSRLKALFDRHVVCSLCSHSSSHYANISVE